MIQLVAPRRIHQVRKAIDCLQKPQNTFPCLCDCPTSLHHTVSALSLHWRHQRLSVRSWAVLQFCELHCGAALNRLSLSFHDPWFRSLVCSQGLLQRSPPTCSNQRLSLDSLRSLVARSTIRLLGGGKGKTGTLPQRSFARLHLGLMGAGRQAAELLSPTASSHLSHGIHRVC